MANKNFMTAGDVAEELGVSKAFAYKVIKKFNNELETKGYFTVSGKVNKQYFLDRTYYRSDNMEREEEE